MRHNDDAYATMLLVCQITADREELVRPLTGPEWHALRAQARAAGIDGMRELMRLDMSGFMLKLGVREQDAYRYCVLLGRLLPLSMALERMAEAGIDFVTVEEAAYPAALRETLGVQAPPVLYYAGRPELFRQDAIAICGAYAAKGAVEERVRELVRMAVDAGYMIVTDGERGVSRIAEDEAVRAGGHTLEVLADALAVRVREPDMAEKLAARAVGAITQTHPDAPYTIRHALHRNKLLHALGAASFVFCAEEKKGATWDGVMQARRQRYANFVYVWDTDAYPGNRGLIASGATPFDRITQDMFQTMQISWHAARAEQLSMFDREQPLL